MVVVKIGGSLQSTKYIRYWIKAVKLNRNTSFLLVFGGGKYADEIRRQQKIKLYSDYEAHKNAVNAMKSFTKDYSNELKDFLYIKSVDSIKKNYKKRKLLTWLPSVNEVSKLNIPLDWNATSDSIALAIAKKTNSPLIIVKSLKFNSKKYMNSFFLKDQILDKYFSDNYKLHDQKISITSRDKFYKLKKICKDFSRNINC